MSNEDTSQCIKRKYSSFGLEILVDVCGVGQKDVEIKIEEKYLVIKGEAVDRKTIKVNKKIPIVQPVDILAFDPHKVVVPFTKHEAGGYEKCYNVKCIK